MAIYTRILTGGSNNHETTSEDANNFATDFVSEGIVGAVTNTSGVAPTTGGFALNEQGTPAMAVDVSAGVAYVTATPSGQGSQVFRVESTATEVATIAANSSGSTRYDWIYIDFDATAGANPAVNGDDVSDIVVSRSTSSSSDDGTPPTYGYLLGIVTVANGASSIVDANIADSRAETVPVPNGTVTNAKLSTTAGEPGGAWETWSPTLGATGSMTWTSTSVTWAKYIQIGKNVYFRVKATGTTGGTASNALTFTVPIAANTEMITGFASVGPAYVGDSVSTMGFSFFNNSTTEVAVRRYDGANFGLGASRSITVTGVYEAA
jgi:hypothetical protein